MRAAETPKMEELLPVIADDDRSTLEAALAFIDTHYVRPSRPVDAATRERNSEAAARTHRKRREELLRLREECGILQATVDALQARADAGGSSDATRKRRACTDATLDAAVAERQRVRDALMRNRRLRQALEAQRGLGAQIAQVICERMSHKCVQNILQETAVAASGAPRLDADGHSGLSKDRKYVLDDLFVRLRAFSAQAATDVTSASREFIMSESRTRLVHRQGHGPVVESTSSVQIPCELDDGWAYLMEVYCHTFAKINRREYGYTAKVKPIAGSAASEKEYSLDLTKTERDKPIHVDGLAIFEMYISPDLKLFVWSALVSIRGGSGVQVRECGWTAMTRATTDPQNGSVLHHHHELHSASGGSAENPLNSKCLATRFLAQSLLQKARLDRDTSERAMMQGFGADVPSVLALFEP